MRDFTLLDEMYKVQPNLTVVFFFLFIIFTLYYLANIFVSLVILIYNEVKYKRAEKEKLADRDELLKSEHWSYKFNRIRK